MTQEQQGTVDLGFNLGQLKGLIAAVKEKPQAGSTVWKASTQWRRGDGFRSVAQIREFDIPMDEPPPLGGANTAPNMVEMVLGAFGCCLTTGYVLNAALRGIELDDVRVELDADLDLNGFFDLADGTWPGYTDVRARVRLDAPKAEADQLRALHDHVVRTSPVGCILSRPVNVQVDLQS